MIFDGLNKLYDDYFISLKELVAFIDNYNSMKNDKNDNIKRNAIKNRKFYSNSIIITLYGDFERTIKLMAEEFINKKYRIFDNNVDGLVNLSFLNARDALRCIESPKTYRKDSEYSKALKIELTKSLNSQDAFEVKADLLLNNFMNAISSQIADLATNYLEINEFNNRIKKKNI